VRQVGGAIFVFVIFFGFVFIIFVIFFGFVFIVFVNFSSPLSAMPKGGNAAARQAAAPALERRVTRSVAMAIGQCPI
jgi:hypothetical protein